MGRYFTWHDVSRALSEVASPPWKRAEVEPTKIEIEASSEAVGSIQTELRRTFGDAFDGQAVELVSVASRLRKIPIEINPRQLRMPLSTVARPLWSSQIVPDSHVIRKTDPVVAAFFSYKGGVGRTTTALAVVSELLSRTPSAKILLIDADLEAPGLTWLIDRNDRLCLIDAMVLVHESEDWRRDALPTIAGLLQANLVHLELPCGRREVYFMPAMRDIAQALRLPITFEQLVRARGRATVVGDLLLELGAALNLDAVVVDLRAGITEFSSPLLFDPRIHPVLVTSCNTQSVAGTLATLEACRKRVPNAEPPDVVVTLVPPDAPELADDIRQSVLEVLDAAGDLGKLSDSIPSDLRFEVFSVEFAQELLHYANLEDLLLRRMPGTELAKRVAPALAARILPKVTIGPTVQILLTPKDIAKAAEGLEVAENLSEPGLLPIPALRSLYEQPTGRLPAAVVLGSKGAGKTFGWGQMILAGTWSGFGSLLGCPLEGTDAEFFPLLSPRNMGNFLFEAAERAQQNVLAGRASALSAVDLTRLLEGHPSGDGLIFWLTSIAGRLGLPSAAARSVRDLNSAIASSGKRVVLVTDGLEDSFQPSPGKPLSEDQQRLMRALLLDLPNSLREIGQTSVGMVTFVRRDLAEEALPQNFRQFEHLHSGYQLTWTPTDVLRLPAWLLIKRGWPGMTVEEVTRAPYEDLRTFLIKFWAEKLGGKSEAYTDRWVIAALSDLKGRLQARDVIRLVRFAADRSGKDWPLAHRAIRDALEDCSKLKLDELQREIKGLEPILKKLREQPEELMVVPFTASSLGLEEEEVRFMEQHGLVTQMEHGDPSWHMPEIVRAGLGYKLKAGARPKTLEMYRRAMRPSRRS